MSLVFAGICSHAPGITGRAHMADRAIVDELYGAYRGMAAELAAAKPDALVIVAAEHFANFFMNNMPAFAVGMAESYEGPIEDPEWLGIARTAIPGNAPLSQRLIREMMQTVDLAYAEEWKFDHGVMVPLSFLTPRYDLPVIPVNINCQGPPLAPLHRAWTLGEALRRAADLAPERIALVGTGGISHWRNFCGAGKATTSARCCRIRTRPPIATQARGDSRFAPSSALQRRRKVWAASDITAPSRFLRWAAPSPPWPLVLKPCRT